MNSIFTVLTFLTIKFPSNTINTIDVKVRTGLSHPSIWNYNSRTKSIVSKSYYFKNTNRLFTFSRNTITKMYVKTSFFYLFKNSFIFLNCFTFRNKITPTRKINLHNTCFRIKIKFLTVTNTSNLSSVPTGKSLTSNSSIK